MENKGISLEACLNHASFNLNIHKIISKIYSERATVLSKARSKATESIPEGPYKEKAKKGIRLKRTPVDGLIEMGILPPEPGDIITVEEINKHLRGERFDYTKCRDAFFLIAQKISPLSSDKRKMLTDIFSEAIKLTLKEMQKPTKPKEAKVKSTKVSKTNTVKEVKPKKTKVSDETKKEEPKS